MKAAFHACALAALTVVLALGAAIPASAQEVISREVVQPLPSSEVERLNQALLALSKAPRDRDALIEAGSAAMGVNDLDAAIGFFGRAADIDPGHPSVARGLAGVYLRAGRAGEALVQFDRALAAGVPEGDVLADRALTLDLVGDQAQAQEGYARALTLDPANDEARRRLAISHAISGNRTRFEEALRPLLDKRDTAAHRARAFGLAILGDDARAATIVEQMMPRDMSTRLVPYLAYMPRLTRPQQAAAANLGIFPRAADIGRDDPRLARFAAEERTDNRLTPSGPPLDARSAPPPTLAELVPPARAAVTPLSPVSAAAVAPAPAPSTEVPAPTAAPELAAVPVAGPEPATALPPARAALSPPPPAPAPTPAPVPALQASPVAPPPATVNDAFADLSGNALPDPRVGGDAVDLSRITVKREAPPPPAKPKPKEPPKPLHPSRVWVQVATGKNIDAFRFDWRRISRSSGDILAQLKPHTTRWGEAHRLLAGPVDGRDAAQKLVSELKAKSIDSFLYVSPEGQEIQSIQ